MNIAVDAMGGDFAPGVVIEGLVAAINDFPHCKFTLVGNEPKVRFYLEKYGLSNHPHIELVHAPTVCEMSDPSTVSLRGKKDSSITVCAKLLKEKKVDAMVTPGHTGATVAATKVLVRTLPGISRPGLAANMPAQRGRFLLMDAGADVDSNADNLVQFAVMAEIYAQYVYKKANPRVGLLSVGGEDVKGNELTKKVFPLLKKLPINFIGNVEPDAAFEGAADVVICDGFSGNVMLKSAEGLAKATVFWLKQVLTKNALRIVWALVGQNAFHELKEFGSSDRIGGAPLLGVNGVCIIGHGGSSPEAVRNAIRVAIECVEFKLNEKIVAKMQEVSSILAKE